LMICLAATSLLGCWWVDSSAGAAVIPVLIKEGRAAIAGGECCP